MLFRVILLAVALTFFVRETVAAADRPNILWITSEDNGPHLGCYGDAFATTPNLDAFARRGLRYERAWSNAPVCAPARTAIITGRHPIADGAEHMRSSVPLPDGHKLFPQFMREAGYYCTNNSKEDYNVVKPPGVWDESSSRAHYKNRPAGAPFFAVFNIGITHEGQIRDTDSALVHDPAKVPIPAYHPDAPEVRRNWARYYDKMTEMDAEVGRLLRELEAAGEAERTIVFYYGDHGAGLPRSKRWPYDSGLRVPLIVHVPETFAHLAPPEYRAGAASDRLVSFVDLGPTVLSIAGIGPPAYFHGAAFAGQFAAAGTRYMYGYRGRMDERYDFMRTVTDGRYVYLRHYLPHLPFTQYVSTMFRSPTMIAWEREAKRGRLTPPQRHFWEDKPVEELYDLQSDPWEANNLLARGEHAEAARFRAAELEQARRVGDLGIIPEAERMRMAAGKSPRDATEGWRRQYFTPALELARAASDLRDKDHAAFVAALRHRDPTHRYWGIVGLRGRGRQAVLQAREPLMRLLEDESPSVRVAAAEALGTHGVQREIAAALATLVKLADSNRNGLYVALEASIALDGLDEKARPVRDAIAALPRQATGVDPRVQTYAGRVIVKILADLDGVPAVIPPGGNVAPAPATKR